MWANKETLLFEHGRDQLLVSPLPVPDSNLDPAEVQRLLSGKVKSIKSGLGYRVVQMPVKEYVQRYVHA